MSEILGIIAGCIILAGAPPYLFDILKRKTKPERTTWFIWSVLGIIAFSAQLQVHGGWSLLFVGLDAVGSVLVFLLSLRFGVGGWKLLDKLALGVAATGLAIAFVVQQPIIALLGVVLADISGATLTIIKTYKAPDTETTITWLCVGTASLLSALAVGKWQASTLIYPVYLTLGNYGVVTAQLFGRLAKQPASSAK
jgi:hypothetical protein